MTQLPVCATVFLFTGFLPAQLSYTSKPYMVNTSGEEADETGIVVAGKDKDGHGYVLADISGRARPSLRIRGTGAAR